jgi:ABC-type branched-subunit amino acid transport system substrate-binding protein
MGPYKKVFILVISQNNIANYNIEDNMANTLISRGFNVVRSTDIFPPKFFLSENFTKEQLAESIKKTDCDAVLTLALLDTKKVETYTPGTS